MKRIILGLLALAPGILFGANSLTVGNMTLESSFERIMVAASYTGDDDGDATCLLEFSPAGAGTWSNAYTPVIDRRATIGSFNNAANYRQARGSVFFRTADTAYDIRLTWTDPDGVVGTNPVTGTISTRDLTPPVSGVIVPATTSNIASVLAAVSPGDTVRLAAGDYPALTFSRSGNAGAWIKYEPATAGTVSIGSGSVGMAVTGSYLWFDGFTIDQTTTHGAQVSGSANFVMFSNCTWPNEPSTDSYGNSCVYYGAGVGHLWIRSCTFNSNDPPNSGENYGRHFAIFGDSGNTVGGHIFQDLTITGTFRDGIATLSEGFTQSMGPNTDLVRLTASGAQDDGVEWEGRGINSAMIDCLISNHTGNSVVGSAGTGIGPTWYIRNRLWSTGGNVVVKNGNTDYGPEIWLHNTLYTTGSGDADGFSELGGQPWTDYAHYRNNIIYVARHSIYRGGTSGGGVSGGRHPNFDYNYYGPNNLANEWNGSPNYATLAAFNSATGFEAHGRTGGNPFTAASSGNFTLVAGTSARNSGEVLANINDASSNQPYQGAAPDMGALEASEGGADVSDPTVAITSPTSSATYSTASAALTIGGIATDNVAVVQVTVTMTGATTGSVAISGTTSWSGSTTLTAGVTVLTATSFDAAGNDSTVDTLTVTYTPPDTTPPVVSARSETPASSTTCYIAWTTDEAASNVVQYGLTTGYGGTTPAGTLGTSHNVRITGLTPGTLYHYRIVSADAAGNSTPTSDGTFTTLALPSTPTVTATEDGTDAVDVSWTNVAGETGYQLERSLAAASGFVLIQTLAADVTSFSNTGLNDATTYYYRVRAYVTRDSTTDYSAYSTVDDATTDAEPGEPPPSEPLPPGQYKRYIPFRIP